MQPVVVSLAVLYATAAYLPQRCLLDVDICESLLRYHHRCVWVLIHDYSTMRRLRVNHPHQTLYSILTSSNSASYETVDLISSTCRVCLISSQRMKFSQCFSSFGHVQALRHQWAHLLCSDFGARAILIPHTGWSIDDEDYGTNVHDHLLTLSGSHPKATTHPQYRETWVSLALARGTMALAFAIQNAQARSPTPVTPQDLHL